MLKRVEKKDKYGDTIICTVDENGVEQGPYEIHYKDGHVGRGTFKDGKKNGPYESYYADGQLCVKATHKNDVWEGLYEGYSKNGNLGLKCFLTKGRYDGVYESFYENGKLEAKGTYNYGSREGEWGTYYINGQLSEKSTYCSGQVLEILEAYNHNGETVKPDIYCNSESKSIDEEKWLKWEKWKLNQERLAEKEVHEKDHVAKIEAIKQRYEAELDQAKVIAGLKGRLEMIADPVFRKAVGPARTPERQAKAEEIVEVRRARTLLRRVAQQAKSKGDTKLLTAVARVAKPYAKRAEKIQNDFRKKRAERCAKKDRD